MISRNNVSVVEKYINNFGNTENFIEFITDFYNSDDDYGLGYSMDIYIFTPLIFKINDLIFMKH